MAFCPLARAVDSIIALQKPGQPGSNLRPFDTTVSNTVASLSGLQRTCLAGALALRGLGWQTLKGLTHSGEVNPW